MSFLLGGLVWFRLEGLVWFRLVLVLWLRLGGLVRFGLVVLAEGLSSFRLDPFDCREELEGQK